MQNWDSQRFKFPGSTNLVDNESELVQPVGSQPWQHIRTIQEASISVVGPIAVDTDLLEPRVGSWVSDPNMRLLQVWSVGQRQSIILEAC